MRWLIHPLAKESRTMWLLFSACMQCNCVVICLPHWCLILVWPAHTLLYVSLFYILSAKSRRYPFIAAFSVLSKSITKTTVNTVDPYLLMDFIALSHNDENHTHTHSAPAGYYVRCDCIFTSGLAASLCLTDRFPLFHLKTIFTCPYMHWHSFWWL